MQQLLADLIAAALAELAERGVVEGEIEYSLPVTIVTVCGYFVFLAWNWYNDGKWHAYESMSTTFLACAVCEASTPRDQGRVLEGRFVCRGCASPFFTREVA